MRRARVAYLVHHFGIAPPSRRAAARSGRPLGVEALEDRSLPSATGFGVVTGVDVPGSPSR